MWGWADPGATVDIHVHGIVRQNITADGSGRWSQHIGQERGNARIEVRQMKTGRPWSGWSRMVVQQLQMPQPTINFIDSSHYWVSRKRRTRSNS